jgi:hypothetical protein
MTGTSAMNGDARKATSAIVPMAARHDGSARAAAYPDRSDASRPAGWPAGGASRTKPSASTTARNETALATNATG